MTGMYVSEAVICHGVLDISQYRTNEKLRYDWLWVLFSLTDKDASFESKLKPSRVSARLALGGIGCKTEEPIRVLENRGC